MVILMTEMYSAQLKDLILQAIKVYNRFRSPEATAKLVGVNNNGFVIDFEGSFCVSCGVREYFEDLIYELEGINDNISVKLQKTKTTGPNSFRASYKIIDSSSKHFEDSLFREFLLERSMSFNDYLTANSCTKDVILFHFRTWLIQRKENCKKE
jgi:hypothetical protein